MKAYAPLWSADLLASGAAAQRVDPFVAGCHLDAMEGVCVPDLWFGLGFVQALRRRTQRVLDVASDAHQAGVIQAVSEFLRPLTPSLSSTRP